MMYPSRFVDEIPVELLSGGFDTGGSGAEDFSEGSYVRGSRVYHDAYGPGTVIKSKFNGYEEAVEVMFDTGSVAVFVPEFTPLEKIADDELI